MARFQEWVKALPARLANSLVYSLLALAILIIIIGLIIFVTGNAGSLNRLLGTPLNIFGATTYRPEIHSDVMLGMMRNFYPGLVPFVAILAIVLVLLAIWGVVSFLTWLGQKLIQTICILIGQSNVRILLATILISWSVAIFVMWLVLNTNQTIYYLLTGLGLMVINLILAWLFRGMVVLVRDEEVNESTRSAD